MRSETKPRNRAACLKCRDIVESRHRHDWRQCKCGAMFVDGGSDYLRRGGEMDQIRELPDQETLDAFLAMPK